MNKYFVFDVESIGLYGDAFAVAYVVVDESGKELDSRCFAVDRRFAKGPDSSRKWCEQNIPEITFTHPSSSGMRSAFWFAMRQWIENGAIIATDVPYPAESSFLAACVRDGESNSRDFQAPYPLIDIASVRFAKGFDLLATELRLPNELPQNHPLADSRQSARLLLEALGVK